MARIYTENKCFYCGQSFNKNDKAIVISKVNVAVDSYNSSNYSYPLANGVAKLQFLGSADKVLFHLECFGHEINSNSSLGSDLADTNLLGNKHE